MKTTPYFANINAAEVKVRHVDLKRFGKSEWRSVCPVCNEGILLGPSRSLDTWALCSRHDRCTRCGQPVEYTDATINDEGFEDGV